jgi:hypothetical protein
MKNICPKCKYETDCDTSISNEPVEPKHGDISLCLKCGAINQFGTAGLIPATPENLSEVDPMDVQKLFAYQRAIREKIKNKDWIV